MECCNVRCLIALAGFSLVACVHRGVSHPSPYVPTRPIAFTVLNFGRRPIQFEFRVDGVQVIDTTVRVGGLPPLVLERQIRLTPGKHRLELYDPRNDEYHLEDFDVRASDMTVEVRLFDARSELHTYYSRIGYM